ALAGLARLDLAAGRRQDATDRLAHAIALAPNNVDLLLLAARTHATVGDLKQTESLLQRALEVDPSNIQAYSLLGQLYVQQRRTEDAKAKFDEVLRRNPASVAASTMIGLLNEQEGNRVQAIKDYQRTLSIDPRAGVAANNLAYLYVSANDRLDEALQLAQTASQARPGNRIVADTLGWIYVKKNQPAMGIPHLEASAARMPTEPQFHYHLGMAYFQAGEFDKAKRALTKALELKPDFDGAAAARK